MKTNNKRFEFVLPVSLFKRVYSRALVEDMSLAKIIRGLLERWDRGEISTGANGNHVTYRAADDREMFFYANAGLIYKFGVVAAKKGMNRIQLLQRLMQAVVDENIDIDKI